MDEYKDIIQKGLDELSKSKWSYIPIYKIVPKNNEDTKDEEYIKKRKMLMSSALFEEHLSGTVSLNYTEYIKLSSEGWSVITDYKGSYSDYRDSLKPMSKKLSIASVISNLVIAVFIVMQTFVLIRSESHANRMDDLSKELQLLEDKLTAEIQALK